MAKGKPFSRGRMDSVLTEAHQRAVRGETAKMQRDHLAAAQAEASKCPMCNQEQIDGVPHVKITDNETTRSYEVCNRCGPELRRILMHGETPRF
jgi:uncharacterized protein with PIN domain